MAHARKPTATRPELLPDGSDGQFRGLIRDLLAFFSRMESIRQGFGASIGLSGPQYTILISIAELQGDTGVGVNAIAERLHLSGPFVTSEVNKLVALSLVDKRANPLDRRRVLLTVAPEGWRRLDGLSAIQQPVNDALFESLSPGEFQILSRVMAELIPCAERAQALQDFLSYPQPGRARRAVGGGG